MAGYFGKYIIEWKCLKPEVYGETHGYIEWTGRSPHDVAEDFSNSNPDYKVLKVTLKTNG